MKLIFAQEPLPENKSIFLAGPTPRQPTVKSWRPEMVYTLASLGFDDVIILPEPRDKWCDEYDHQIAWENNALLRATCILFWIPRNLDTMPGFTTNCEWGEWKNSQKVVLGYPENAAKMRYLHWHAELYKVPIAHTMKDVAQEALKIIRKSNV